MLPTQCEKEPKYLAREFYPIFNESDFINLPNHHIYLKLMIDGITSKPFSAITLKSAKPARSYKDRVIEASRKLYSKPRADVEREITERLNCQTLKKVSPSNTSQSSLL